MQTELAGSTMGTRYTVSVVTTAGRPSATLAADIAALLDEVNAQMSTYDPQSTLSSFNRFASTNWFPVSDSLCVAVADALLLAERTNGAFDITLGSIVNLWGFGPDAPISVAPPRADIEVALQASGFRKLQTDCGNKRLQKMQPDLQIDLSAYAKGLAVDLISAMLMQNGIPDFLVEIGGEIRAAGRNRQGEKWRIAVEMPDSSGGAVQAVLRLTEVAVATSGDYRNYFEVGSVRYSHTIDGRSGAPVTHSTASVTIVSQSAAEADGMATALLVMGHEEGLRFAVRNNIAALFVVRQGNTFENHSSDAMSLYLEN